MLYEQGQGQSVQVHNREQKKQQLNFTAHRTVASSNPTPAQLKIFRLTCF